MGLLVAALVLAACGGGDNGDSSAPTTTDATGGGAGVDATDRGKDNPSPSQGRIELAATLTGDAEVPGPGDGDGRGAASLTVDVNQNEACITYGPVTGIGEPTAAHIHRGTKDESGPPVVTLPVPKGVDTEPNCNLDVDRDVVTAIAGNPSGFYVNVHTSEFPNGAIRGQLTAA